MVRLEHTLIEPRCRLIRTGFAGLFAFAALSIDPPRQRGEKRREKPRAMRRRIGQALRSRPLASFPAFP